MRSLARKESSKLVILTIILLSLLTVPASLPTVEAAPTLSANGVGPTTISLTWTQSSSLLFTSYRVEHSASGSEPWTTYATITSITQTSQYVQGRKPSTTSWWRVVETDTVTSTSSSIIQVTQKPVATLSYQQPTSSNIQLGWNNHASYGGMLTFGSYQLMQTVNDGTYTVAATITTQSQQSHALTDLTPGSSYSFYLTTTDQCTGCSGGAEPSTSNSNTVGLVVGSPVTASATASPKSADVGQTVSFGCIANGGRPPYSYAWIYGDGNNGTGQSTEHIYRSPGTMTATCTATDSLSTQASSSIDITISPEPSVTVYVDRNSTGIGGRVTFTARATGGPGSFTSYSWSFGDGATASGATVTHTYSRAGSFDATVTVADGNGVTATGRITITVSPNAGPPTDPPTLPWWILAFLVGTVAVVIAGIAIPIWSDSKATRRSVRHSKV